MKKKIKSIIPSFALSLYHWFLALFGAVLFGFPSRKIKVIGVTGTNGKTTTINLISEILNEAGYTVASLSSLQFRIKDKEKENKLRMTMPGRGLIQAFLKKAVDAGCEYAVVEVTSEGVAQHRHRFIQFDAAVFTNLSPEHIESHGSFEDYKKAKGRFFKAVKNIHVLNRDDKHFNYFDSFKARRKYLYGTGSYPEKVVGAENIKADSEGISFEVEEVSFKLALLGEFNVKNALAALCVGLSQGVDLQTASRALEGARGVPGRMEVVRTNPTVVVDYAFTPNALEKVYDFLKTSVKEEEGKMICVLGACGGGRDKWKRPVLGELAGKYCDRVIVTNEDPYDEDPREIIKEVAKGAGEAEEILDRRKAIRKALEIADREDIVVITGKGAEPSIVKRGGEKIPWDDRKVAREEYERVYE